MAKRAPHTPARTPRPAVTLVGACAFELPANPADGAAVQLLPAGEFRARDGRPHDADAWRLTATLAAGVIERAAARRNDTVIDYDHQTLHVEWNGQPAPAAGWFRELVWRDGVGLFAADARWTDRARQMIAAQEYRYISAVFLYRSGSGEVLEILHAGLTNDPAIDGMSEVMQRAAARFAVSTETDHQEDPHMDRDALIAALALAADATDDDITAALAALTAKAAQVEGLETEVAALKAAAPGAGTPDPTRYVGVEVVEQLKTEIAALRSEQTGRDVDALVTAALADGRLLAAQEQWARDLGESNVTALRQYLDTAQPIAALRGTQTGGRPPAGGQGGQGGEGGGALGREELAVCRQLGVSPEDYTKTRQAHQAELEAQAA